MGRYRFMVGFGFGGLWLMALLGFSHHGRCRGHSVGQGSAAVPVALTLLSPRIIFSGEGGGAPGRPRITLPA